MINKLWAAEPVVMSLLSSAAIWSLFFKVLEAYGYQPTVGQQSALTALFVALAGAFARSQVTPTKKESD